MSEKLPLLHIGYGKTGTTWFQKNFYPNVKDIEFYDLNKVRATIGSSWKLITNKDEIKKAFPKSQNRLVICDESMVGNGSQTQINLQNFKDIFYPAQVVIFIRNQINKLPSNYNQYVKDGGKDSFKDFLLMDKNKAIWEKHKYDKIINLYKKSFGASNVYVYLYEDFCGNPKEFMITFCKNHNLLIDLEHLNIKILNESFSRTVLNLKMIHNRITRRILNRFQPSPSNTELTRFLKWIRKTAYFFDRLNSLFPKERLEMEKHIGCKNTEVVKAYFRESNNRLISEHGLIKIKDYNYPI